MAFAAGPYTITLGGSALLAGGRSTGTITVSGCTTGMHVKVTPQSDPGAGYAYGGFIATNGTVTVWIMAMIALTPPSTVYNVTVEG